MQIKIKVTPNAKKNMIKEGAGMMKVYLTAPAVDGKANQALVRFLAQHYNVNKSHVGIIKGEKSREKVVDIRA